MSRLYGMQRANGDWFAISVNGNLRMTVFASIKEAMVARSRNSGMECFKPVELDERALDDLKTTDGDTICFCLVSKPARKLQLGRPIDFTQLTSLRRSVE